MTKVRTLKVTEQTRINGTPHRRTISRYPKIKLSGKWLRMEGFSIGDFVNVMITEQAIHIIKKAKLS
ncbi:MAG: SymE family type I addiction module toxin [Sediminibacterium sp.]